MAIKLSFDYRHYVPILRHKGAEMQALRFLLPEHKRGMTPLIELPPSLLAMKARKKDLSEYKKNRQYERLRYDWLYWFGEVKNGPSLPRSPSFGDYAIQHPFYSEPSPTWNVSASSLHGGRPLGDHARRGRSKRWGPWLRSVLG